MIKSVYCLWAVNEQGGADIFYVGCTDDARRRLGEHRRNAHNENSSEYNTDKYSFIRYCDRNNIEWDMTIVTDALEVTDQFDEYSWVLRVARENEQLGIMFPNGESICNMRAGDLLSEMIRDRNLLDYSSQSLRMWHKIRQTAIESRRTSLEREQQQYVPEGYVENPLQTEQRNNVMQSISLEAAASRQESEAKARRRQQRAEKTQKSIAEARQRQQQEWLNETKHKS